ncbi:hypothetical protein BGZ74_001381 [Mortierella antarctica]|nr:hypothetical protein BGZ74_001381 [Mortierella antarctica]
MGSQKCEDDLLARITTLSTLCMEISPAIHYSEQTLYGPVKPFDTWSMAWERFVKVLTEPLETTLPMLPSPSRSSLPTPHSVHEVEWDTIEQHLQEANRHGKTCLLHYLDRIVLSGTQVPRHLGSLLPSFSLVRSLEMTLKDAAYLNLSEIFEHCVDLRHLNIVGPHNAVVDLFLHHHHDEDSSTGEEPHLRLPYPKLTSLSHDRKRVVKLHNAGEKNLERFLKHPPSDPCTLLPHPTTWVCHRLTRLSLRIKDKLPLVLASVAQACPQLQELVVKTNILMLGQSHKVEDQTWLIEQSRHHPQALVEHRSWHTRQHRLSGMVAEVRYKYVELEDQIRCLSSLRGLERLVFRVSYLPGEVFTGALQWLKLGDSAAKRDGDWRRRLDNVWPNLELLSITYWHRTCDVGVLPAWEKGLQMMRPGAEVRIAYDPVDID